MTTFTPGKLYVLPIAVENPAGLKRGGYGLLFSRMHHVPAGAVFECLTKRQALASMLTWAELVEQDDTKPYCLRLVDRLQLRVPVGRRMQTQMTSSAGARIALESGFQTERLTAGEAEFFARILAALVEKTPTPADDFRAAGFPLDDRYDRGFEVVCTWAVEKGLLKLDQVKAWAEAKAAEEKAS